MPGKRGEGRRVCEQQEKEHNSGKWRSVRRKRGMKDARGSVCSEPEVAARKANGAGPVTIRQRIWEGDL
jgi:hypothetical protein